MAGVPKYEKLKALLRDKIVSGKYEKGDRFFSQNELMEKYGLSFSSVTRALEELVREGYLVRQRGKGTYINATDLQNHVPESGQVKLHLFSPWNSSSSALSSSSEIYKQLQMMQLQKMEISFVPHGDAPDDLEPFLFILEPGDTAVFLYPLPHHHDFINTLAESASVIVVSEVSFRCMGRLLVTPVAEAATVVTQHLIDLGHYNIAVVGDRLSGPHLSELLDGYRLALRSNGILYNESLVPKSEENAMADSNLAQILEKNSEKEITAVFATSSTAAVSVLSELRVMGKKAGTDMSVACYDDLEKSVAAFPSLTTVSFSSKDLASHILKLVMHRESSKVPTAAITVQPRLVVRSSSVGCTTAT